MAWTWLQSININCCLTSPFPPASSTAAAAPAAGRGRCWRREVTKAGSPGSQTVLPSCQGTLPPAVGWNPSGFQPVLLCHHHQLGFSNMCTTRGTRYFLLQIRTPSLPSPQMVESSPWGHQPQILCWKGDFKVKCVLPCLFTMPCSSFPWAIDGMVILHISTAQHSKNSTRRPTFFTRRMVASFGFIRLHSARSHSHSTPYWRCWTLSAWYPFDSRGLPWIRWTWQAQRSSIAGCCNDLGLENME